MTKKEKCRLLFGPYKSPNPPRGGYLTCKIRGKVKVGSWSQGPISWPKYHKGGGYIIGGDLYRALQVESVWAISKHWGVRRETVSKWRRALGIQRLTVGTSRLYRERAKEWSTPRRIRKMVELARTPDARRKISEARKGTPILPHVKKAFLKQARKPKTERWKGMMKQRTSERILRGEVSFIKPNQLWTKAQISKLGTKPDQELAKELRKTLMAVKLKRQRLGIKRYRPR